MAGYQLGVLMTGPDAGDWLISKSLPYIACSTCIYTNTHWSENMVFDKTICVYAVLGELVKPIVFHRYPLWTLWNLQIIKICHVFFFYLYCFLLVIV